MVGGNIKLVQHTTHQLFLYDLEDGAIYLVEH